MSDLFRKDVHQYWYRGDSYDDSLTCTNVQRRCHHMIAICLPDHAVEKTLIAERERMMASRDLLCAGEAAVVRSAGTSAGLLFKAVSLHLSTPGRRCPTGYSGRELARRLTKDVCF